MDKKEIENLIRELVEKTTVSVNEVTITEEGPSNTWFSLEVSEPHFFTLREGEALFALNHLVRKMIETRMPTPTSFGVEAPESPQIMIDIGSFQKRKVDGLRAVAHMMAERARYFKSSVEVDPMPAFERRIVHEFLSNATDLKTESTGLGSTRRVVIKYIGGI